MKEIDISGFDIDYEVGIVPVGLNDKIQAYRIVTGIFEGVVFVLLAANISDHPIDDQGNHAISINHKVVKNPNNIDFSDDELENEIQAMIAYFVLSAYQRAQDAVVTD